MLIQFFLKSACILCAFVHGLHLRVSLCWFNVKYVLNKQVKMRDCVMGMAVRGGALENWPHLLGVWLDCTSA